MKKISLLLIGLMGLLPIVSEAQVTIKVMQYNLQGNVNQIPDKAGKMANQIIRQAPDFLTTQETTLGGSNFLQQKFDQLPTKIYKIAIGPTSDLAIFYNQNKWKVVQSEVYPNKMTPDYQVSPVRRKAGDRVLVMAKFLPVDEKGQAIPNGKPVIIYTSHWCVAWSWNGSYKCANATINPTGDSQANPAHLRDAKALLNTISDAQKVNPNAAVIFTGDLNVHDDRTELGLQYTDDAPAIKELSGILTEGYRALNSDRTKESYRGSTWGDAKLDFIFSKASGDAQFNLKPVASMVDNETYSDHRPVLVTYTEDGQIPVPVKCDAPEQIDKKYDPLQGSVIQWINNDVNKSFEVLGWNNQQVPGSQQTQLGNQYTFIDASTKKVSGKFTYYLKTACKDPVTKIIVGTNVTPAIDIYK